MLYKLCDRPGILFINMFIACGFPKEHKLLFYAYAIL